MPALFGLVLCYVLLCPAACIHLHLTLPNTCCFCRRFKNREAARRVRERKSTMLNTYKSQASPCSLCLLIFWRLTCSLGNSSGSCYAIAAASLLVLPAVATQWFKAFPASINRPAADFSDPLCWSKHTSNSPSLTKHLVKLGQTCRWTTLSGRTRSCCKSFSSCRAPV